MDFHTFTTNCEARSKCGLIDTADEFYTMEITEAIARGSSQFYQQLSSEPTWEDARKPYYNVWPSIVPMLTRLNLDLDSALIQLSPPALCIRLPKQHNPLAITGRPGHRHHGRAGRADSGDAARRLRAIVLFAVPARKRPLIDRAGCFVQGPGQIRVQWRWRVRGQGPPAW
jgi:hypothetical protein